MNRAIGLTLLITTALLGVAGFLVMQHEGGLCPFGTWEKGSCPKSALALLDHHAESIQFLQAPLIVSIVLVLILFIVVSALRSETSPRFFKTRTYFRSTAHVDREASAYHTMRFWIAIRMRLLPAANF